MAVVIKELVVRAQVENNDTRPATPSPTAPGSAAGQKLDRQLLIEDCVAAVLDVLARRGER